MKITIEGLEELRRRFQQSPAKFSRDIEMTTQAALLVIHENVPGYPKQKAVSGKKVSFKTRKGKQVEWGEEAYRRTGTLGRSLGVSKGGSKQGKPDVYEVTRSGGYVEGRFGTRLNYAPYVIGDPATEQAKHHKGHWWTLVQVKNKSKDKIERLFQIMADQLGSWLEGKGNS